MDIWLIGFLFGCFFLGLVICPAVILIYLVGGCLMIISLIILLGIFVRIILLLVCAGVVQW